MNATTLMILAMVFIAMTMGLGSFMTNLGGHYGKTQTDNLTIGMNATLSNLNKTTNTLIGITSGNQSWSQTTYSIFFTLPSSIISTITSLPGTIQSMVTGVDLETKGIVPGWVTSVVMAIISVVIVFIIVSIIFNRSDT